MPRVENRFYICSLTRIRGSREFGIFKQEAIGTTILGALSTIVASFLARARGSGEPELSVTRVKDLEQYIREVDAFLVDHGDATSNDHDDQLHKFRMRFEELLGNMTQYVVFPVASFNVVT